MVASHNRELFFHHDQTRYRTFSYDHYDSEYFGMTTSSYFEHLQSFSQIHKQKLPKTQRSLYRPARAGLCSDDPVLDDFLWGMDPTKVRHAAWSKSTKACPSGLCSPSASG